MAVSPINAIRNLTSDKLWFIKLCVYAAPVFFFLSNMNSQAVSQQDMLYIALIFSSVYFGSAAFIMNRNINNTSPIMPSLFSIVKLIKDTVFASVLSLPVVAVTCYIVWFIMANVQTEPFAMWIIYICLALFVSPFLLIPITLYSARGKFSDAFKISIFVDCAGNFIVAFMTFVLAGIFIFGCSWAVLYYGLTYMLTDNTLVNVLNSFFIVLVFFSLYSFCSDCYGEVIPKIKPKKKKNQRIDILDD